MNLSKYPDKLICNRDAIECTFVFALYKDPSLIEIYKYLKPEEDILTSNGIFYFQLALMMYNAGYKSLDSMSIFAFLKSYPDWKAEYDKRGGFDTINGFTNVIEVDNIDAFFEALNKSNTLLDYYNKKYPVMENFGKFQEMTSDQIYTYFDHEVSNIGLKRCGNIEVENLSTGYDKYIMQWNEGNDVGFPIASDILNARLLGIHKKNLMLHLAGIGSGKTSTAIAWYVIPALECGNDICIMANEQDEDAWRKMLIGTVMFQKVNCRIPGFNRQKISIGKFSQEVIDKMKEAEEWIESQPGKIYFVDLPSYDVVNVKKIVKTQHARGCDLFILDTMKSLDDSAQNSWGQFSEMAKEIFQLAKNKDIAMIATCQLSPEAMGRKYLDLTCVGRARQISEVANSVVMFRHLTKEERSKITPYVYSKEKVKVDVSTALNPDKDYIMVFTPKNRYGKTDPQIIMESNLDFNTYKDIGYYDCPLDTFRS